MKVVVMRISPLRTKIQNSPRLPSMPIPSQAYAGYAFTINNHEFYTGLFSINNPSFPDIYYPSLLHKEAGVWVEVDKRDGLWKDIQEDIDPLTMINLIVNDFNVTIKTISGGTPTLTWNQKLAKLFREGLVVDAGALKVVPVSL